MNDRECTNLSGWEAVKCIWQKYVYLSFVPALILGMTVGFALGFAVADSSNDNQRDGERFNFIESMIPELIGIGLTITIIYYLEQKRQHQIDEANLKTRLKLEAGSRANSTSVTAVDWLRHKGWLIGEAGLLKDASLVRANLYDVLLNYANLEGADLHDANLTGARLYKANLKNADLRWATLEGAYLRHAILDDVIVKKTILPDGTEWKEDTDIQRFINDNHPQYSETLKMINEIRESKGIQRA